MRLFKCLALMGLTAFALWGCAADPSSFTHEVAGEQKPWLSERFDAAPDKFTFAIISDLNGGERAGVFSLAVDQINLLRPEFVVSVGDLIDGPSEDAASLQQEWDSFDERAAKLRAPFFHVGGNHDLTGEALREFWAARYGPLYYSFVYKNALFLVLDTEDNTPERMKEIFEARNAAIKVLDGPNPEAARDMEYFKMPERISGAVGAEQAAYFEKAIADHPDVRWIFLFMHKPVWQREDDNPFKRIEAALKDRPYSLFNGHFHSYSHTEKNGRDYIILGTTGGGQDAADEHSFDHITLVTMDEGGPSIATLRMDGVLDKSGALPPEAASMCFQASRCAAQKP
ncbi:MAG: metallophosphoesterase [Parvularculaceae bacterium]